ncbi:hypothetical protein TrLO_g15971 [Triparma laevis f. longispina]|uniref:Glutamate--cysteine ligase n=1 Tax=Triparma laevis f. longispina TaxID=1714387 RepID=A0A9W7CP85_9STRA|nr:hypothetical protein TrLO_g15971 [Triparma laevis f. longispina]
MGLLKVGKPKHWSNSKKDLPYVRNAGVRQFVNTYKRVKSLKGDELLWGDEVEYGIFTVDSEKRTLKMALRGKEVMDELNKKESSQPDAAEGCSWVPEYGSWMIESTPSRPYTGYAEDLLRVERNMRLRRKRLLSVLREGEIAPTVSTYPLMGAEHVEEQTVPPSKRGGEFSESSYVSDSIINPHPRFGTLTRNIRERRGEKVNIRVPLFHDKNTPEFKGMKVKPCGGEGETRPNMSVWSYGQAVHEDKNLVMTGCSGSLEWLDSTNNGAPVKLSKWRVNVQDPDQPLKGLYFRSSPGVVVADADWPRNGDVVVGAAVSTGWIRLQNGYYLPTSSEDGRIPYLEKLANGTKTTTTNDGMDRAGFPSPQMSPSPKFPETQMEDLNLKDSNINRKGSMESDASTESTTLHKMKPAIHMDAMGFGMGCCCLQVTFQAKDIDESRIIYDQLAVLSPILMALTASTPFLKGRVADTDCRWGIISESVDDRTRAERGMEDVREGTETMAGEGQKRLFKSRYDSISTYIYQGACSAPSAPCGETGFQNRVMNKYNDIPVPIDEDHYLQLRAQGCDPSLAQHVAHLFIRDPLVIFEGSVEEVDDTKQTEHFESIQSTNWQTVRWKPPPPRDGPNSPHIGWRTEFRSMEMQLTDFENSAFTVFIVLATRAILAFDLNLYLPLSRVDANMQRAHSRDAARTGKFFFRRHMAPLELGDKGYGEDYEPAHHATTKSTAPSPCDGGGADVDDDNNTDATSKHRRRAPCATGGAEENSYEEMTMSEIMNGKGDYFPGLVPLIYAYLELIKCEGPAFDRVSKYLELIRKRSNGELKTPATWMRDYVLAHPDYKKDSVISEAIAHDLMVACKDIGEGKRHEPSLTGDVVIEPILPEDAYQTKLDATRIGADQTYSLLQKYMSRAKAEGGD